MTSLTQYFGLTLPTQAADNNTWGIELNNDLTSIDNILHETEIGYYTYGVDTSTIADTITVSLPNSPITYSAGLNIRVLVANTVTAATTIQVNALGTKNVTRVDFSALQVNDIIAGQTVDLTYDGTQFIYNAPSYILSRVPRTPLTANTTYYVATTGSDTANGLTSTTPWATIQHAISVIENTIDFSGYTATIQVAAGSYSVGGTVAGVAVGSNAANFIILGNTSTPSSCTITVSNGNCFSAINEATLSIQGFKFDTSSSGYGLYASGNSIINFSNCQFDSCASGHIFATMDSEIISTGNSTITGAAPFFAGADGNSVVGLGSSALTITGTPAFSTAFVNATRSAVITAGSVTFSGAATGTQYIVSSNSYIDAGGHGLNFFPGSTGGVQNSGGVYDTFSYGDVADIKWKAVTTPPPGWLICDGTAYSRTAYVNLFNSIGTVFGTGDGSTTFNVPDLRGVNIRGFDSGRGLDPGRQFGSYQGDLFGSHAHSVPGQLFNSNGSYAGVTFNPSGVTSYLLYNGAVTSYAGGTETRGKNVSLLPVIKF